MKKLNSLRIGVILSLLFLFCQNLTAQTFILNDDKLIDDRAKEKINQIGSETKSKLGVNIYVYTKSTLGLDENYNNIMTSNINFLEKYSLELELNGKIFPLTTEDIRYGQRVIEKYSNHKDVLKVGENSLKILVLNKTTKEIVPINIDLLITKTMSDDSNLNLKDENFTKDKNIYTTNFSLNEETNWIITGSFKVEDETGFIFIKTNAK